MASEEKKTRTNKLITHGGSFHTDDIFAAASLALYLEKKGEVFEVIRTRDEQILSEGDYVFDVGGVYDEANNKFDHHQAGGAGKRPALKGVEGENGIDYASFGLVWRKFGEEICGSKKISEIIDQKLASPIDAWDNGIDLTESRHEVSPYVIQHVFSSMRPTWKEGALKEDEMFLRSVEMAKEILSREIIQAKDALLAEENVIAAYHNSKDRRIIVLDNNYPYERALQDFIEPLFVVYPRQSDNFWGAKALRANAQTFDNKQDFPESWGGLRDEELQRVTGVNDAVFCHRGLFLAVAKSREGAVRLAELALLEVHLSRIT